MFFKLTQFDILNQLAADRSSWFDVAHYPTMTLCRRIVRLADFAADDRARWIATRMAFECPELNHRELAVALGSAAQIIAGRLAPVNLADRCDYDAVEYYGEVPAFLRAMDETDEMDGAKTYRNAVALCSVAAAEPKRYNSMRLAIVNGLSQQQIADVLKVTHQQVSKYLANPIKIKDQP